MAIALRTLSAVVLALLLATGTAEASYKGTPGQVAYLLGDDDGWPLKLWDPVNESRVTIEATTWDGANTGTGMDVHGFPHHAGPGDLPSAPSWAPDGSKFAFAKRIADEGDYEGLEHSAIFVYDVATGQTRQVTHPENAVLDKVPEDPPVVGHVVSDFAPAYSPDGTTIAFVRQVAAHGPDDTLWDKRGQNLWRVAQNGGDPAQVTTLLQETGRRVSSGVWIPGSSDLVVSYFTPGLTPALGRVSSSGGNPTFLAGNPMEAITDYDVSPDGKKLAFNSLAAGGVTAFVQPLSGSGAGVAVVAGSGFGAILRFAGTGDGLLHSDCTERSPSICGLLDRLTPDPKADIDSGDRERDRFALAFDEPVPGNGGVPARMALDIQAQELPVIFLPGFLGSRITCGQLGGVAESPVPGPDAHEPGPGRRDGRVPADHGARDRAGLPRLPVGGQLRALRVRGARDAVRLGLAQAAAAAVPEAGEGDRRRARARRSVEEAERGPRRAVGALLRRPVHPRVHRGRRR